MDWFDAVLNKAGDVYGKYADIRMEEAKTQQTALITAVEREQAANRAPTDAKAAANATAMPVQAQGFNLMNVPQHYFYIAAAGFAAIALVGLAVR